MSDESLVEDRTLVRKYDDFKDTESWIEDKFNRSTSFADKYLAKTDQSFTQLNNLMQSAPDISTIDTTALENITIPDPPSLQTGQFSDIAFTPSFEELPWHQWNDLPSSRNFDYNLDYPSVEDIGTVGDPPALELPAVPEVPSISFDDLTDPTVPNLIETMEPYKTLDDEVTDKLRNEFLSKLGITDPDNFYGYTPEIEQGIYDRARSRRRADLQEKKDQATSEMAKRNFHAPPGALNAIKRQYDIEDHREEADLNRDIVRQQADLARQKYEFLVQFGLDLDKYIMERKRFQANTVMEASRLQTGFAIDVLNSELREKEMRTTIYQSQIQAYAEQARLQSVRIDSYRSKIEGLQSKADLQRIKAQILSEERQAKTDQYRMQLESDRINSEAKQLEFSRAVENNRLQVDQARLQVSQNEIEVRKIAEQAQAQRDVNRIGAEIANVEAGIAQSKAQIQTATVDAQRAAIDAHARQFEAKASAAEAQANIAAQIGASALTAVSAQVDLGARRSDSVRWGYDYSVSRRDGITEHRQA